MDRLKYLMIFCCFRFVLVCGRGEDLFVSCEVGLMVRSGVTWTAAPGLSVTVCCPVKHCGASLNVTWCKHNNTNCDRINEKETVEIRQEYLKDELISCLSFTQVSIHDDGLYRCAAKGYKHTFISHAVNISVSDIYQVAEISKYNAVVESPIVAGNEARSWLPRFFLIALMVVTLAVLTLLSFYGWNRFLTCNHTRAEEVFTQMIPDLPRCSAPSAPVLQTHFSVLNDIYSPSTAETPPSLVPTGSEPAVANIADKSQVSDGPVYAVINQGQSGMPARKQHATTKHDKNSEYSVINVS